MLDAPSSIREPVYYFPIVVLVTGWLCGYVAFETATGCGSVWTLAPATWAWIVMAKVASSVFADRHTTLVIVSGAIVHALFFYVAVRSALWVLVRFQFDSARARWSVLFILLPLYFVLIRFTFLMDDCA